MNRARDFVDGPADHRRQPLTYTEKQTKPVRVYGGQGDKTTEPNAIRIVRDHKWYYYVYALVQSRQRAAWNKIALRERDRTTPPAGRDRVTSHCPGRFSLNKLFENERL